MILSELMSFFCLETYFTAALSSFNIIFFGRFVNYLFFIVFRKHDLKFTQINKAAKNK